MLTSDLYASANGFCNAGMHECHWCAAPCGDRWTHDDPPPIPFQRSNSTARRPGSAYVCLGCWMWRRGSVTINYLDGGFQDRGSAQKASWWMTEGDLFALRKEDSNKLYRLLLKPPRRFCLMLRDGNVPNLLQLGQVNDVMEVNADTPLLFTVNGIIHTYTVYELETAARSDGDDSGYAPGIRALLRLFGMPPVTAEAPLQTMVQEKRGRGRPRLEETPNARHTTRLVRASGM